MSEFKFSICLIILAVLFFLSGFLIGRGVREEEYSVTILTEKGDTIANFISTQFPSFSSATRIESKVDRVKIWIEKDEVLDVWVNSEVGGWRRK